MQVDENIFKNYYIELFFIDEYKKRHAMLDTDMTSVLKGIACLGDTMKDVQEITYEMIQSLYKELYEFISAYNLSKEIATLTALISYNGIDILNSLSVDDIIDLLQYHNFYIEYISKEDKATQELFRGLNKCTLLANYDAFAPLCAFLSDEDVTRIIKIFFLVTTKYELFMSELLNPVKIPSDFDDDFITNVKKKHHFLSFKASQEQNHLVIEEAKDKPQFRRLSKIEDIGKINEIFTQNSIKRMKDVITEKNTFRISSTRGRLFGLYLWDACKSPMSTEQKSIENVINLLLEKHSNSSDARTYYRYLANTQKCIEAGEIVPIQ